MYKLTILLAIVTIISAAQLPNSYLPPGSGSEGSRTNGFERSQAAAERKSAVLKLDQEIKEDGFHYAYETSNGIQAEEQGGVGQSRGGFSYKGNDGHTYTVTFTAGEGGFQAQGAHLPVPPPTPQEILLALEQNARDEAAGIFDDGQFKPEVHGDQVANKGSSANHQGRFNDNSGYSY